MKLIDFHFYVFNIFTIFNTYAIKYYHMLICLENTKEAINLKDIIYVTGHKNPDSDSICAAYFMLNLKIKLEILKAVPVRLGNINQETQFILDYFEC